MPVPLRSLTSALLRPNILANGVTLPVRWPDSRPFTASLNRLAPVEWAWCTVRSTSDWIEMWL